MGQQQAGQWSQNREQQLAALLVLAVTKDQTK
jgi:hypothetical protein